jgi:GDPmannose 4,6-dehydratase
LLIGDASKAKEKLGWTASTPLEALCREMVEADLALFSRDAYLRAGGHEVTTPQDS